jgi:hypothetical protein
MTSAFNDKISSAGPDKGTFCTLYSYVLSSSRGHGRRMGGS